MGVQREAGQLKREVNDPVYLRIVQQIKNLIRSGELVPGDQLLSERELAEQFAVSRTSIRKALAVLAGMGAIEVTPRDGAYVRRPTLSEVIDPLSQAMVQTEVQPSHLFELQQVIETQAVRLAALRRDDDDLQRLWALHRRVQEDVEAGRPPGTSDIEFHIGLTQTTKNPLFSEVMTVLISAMLEVYANTIWENLRGDEADLRRFVDEHEQIIRAVAAKNPELAAQRMTDHIRHAASRYEQ